jgi:hypothetical protein
LEGALSDKPNLYRFDLENMTNNHQNLNGKQLDYFLATSFSKIKILVKEYVQKIKRPHEATFEKTNNSIEII